MRKILKWLILPYLILVIYGNYYVNGPMEAKINQRREYFKTEWVVSFFPGVFYAHNLYYTLYTKKFKLTHKVKKSIVVLNPVLLLYKKLSIISASGWDVEFNLTGPDPELPPSKPRRWVFDLADIKLRNLHGKLLGYPFLGHRDSVVVDILIPLDVKDLEFREIRWRARDSEIKGIIKEISGVGSLEFKGPIKDLLWKSEYDLNYNFKVKNDTDFKQVGPLKNLLITQGDIRLNLKVDQAVIARNSFAKVKDLKAEFQVKDYLFKLHGNGEWSNRKQTLNFTFPEFNLLTPERQHLMSSHRAKIKLKAKESGIENWADKQDILIELPDLKVPQLGHWTSQLKGDLSTLRGSVAGDLKLSAKAGVKKKLASDFKGIVDITQLKIKKTTLTAHLDVDGNLVPRKKEPQISDGQISINGIINADFKKPLYPEEDQTVSIIAKNLVINTQNKTAQAKLFTQIEDTKQILNFIKENFKLSRLVAGLFAKENPTVETDLLITPQRIEFNDAKIVIKKHHRILKGDWWFIKPTENSKGYFEGDGIFKFNIFHIRIRFEKGKLKLF